MTAGNVRFSSSRMRAGSFYPLGATLVPGGANFALYSRNATAVELLLFDDPRGEPTGVLRLPDRTRFVWNGFVEGIRPGQFYGYRVHGPSDPAHGLRFDPSKVLVDPYAKALSHKFLEDAPVPKAIVVDDAFDWQGDTPPHLPFDELVIYEAHPKGFTAHPTSGVVKPGTYLGFVEKIPYLKSLGVNAVELLPVHEHVDDGFLRSRGLVNYWGYNTLGFFAPEQSWRASSVPGAEVGEFKTLVRELHRAGLEVILDVVYNHTAEGSELGPVVSWRGIDNPSYYWLTGPPEAPGFYYMNPTGTGNALDLSKPAALRMVLDSLRYWADVMHVDGFRFDLASVLGREDGYFKDGGAFFDAIAQDPLLCRVKLIAEPWDLGTYQVGNFPVDWAEWNGRYRDTVRRFVKGDAGQLRELGYRLTGSADLYGDDGRSPYNSVNFVTCHDGFTLRDLVSYDGKHNEANGEGNRDGTDDNASWNCGAEGETGDAGVLALRARQVRNFLATLLLSSGTPMVLAGDEMFHTQRGNNNAYCQDNAVTWLDWSDAERHADLVQFFRRLVALRRAFPALRRRTFYSGADLDRDGAADIEWSAPGGGRPAWDDPEARTLCFALDAGDDPDAPGAYRVFVILNADWRSAGVVLPAGRTWSRVVDTNLPPGTDALAPDAGVPVTTARYETAPRSVVVLIAGDGA